MNIIVFVHKKPPYIGAKREIRTSCFSNVGQALGEAYLCEAMRRAFLTLEQCETM
jgi:hypothetical protein